MIVKILGLLDIIIAIIFWLFGLFALMPENIVMVASFLLFVKGVFFIISKDIASILDVISAGVIYLSLNFSIPKFVVILVALFLIQKGIFSLLA